VDSCGVGPGGYDERQRGRLLSRRHSLNLAHLGRVRKLKTKPTEVIVHRIELQQKEREIAEGLAYSLMAKNFTAPLVGILSSPLALATIVGIWIAYLSRYLGGGWIEQNWDATVEEVMDWLEPQNLIVGGLGALIGFLLGGPLGAAVGGVAGGAAVEGVEHITEEGPAWASPEEAAENRAWLRRHATAVMIVTTIGAKKFVDEAGDLVGFVTGR